MTNTITNIIINGVNTTTAANTFNLPWSTWSQWLAEVSYKPGWSFELRDGQYSYPYYTGGTVGTYHAGLSLIISAKVIDSSTLGESLIVHTMPMDPVALSTREDFLAEVLRLVCMVERHEAMEFLKASGERVRNPHPSPTEVLYS
jgi:hypothetical protein